jgi:hypothetical protein
MIGSLEMAAAILLAGAGVAKLLAPGPARLMLRSIWSRSSTPEPVVRVAGAAEMIIGFAVMLTGDRAAAIALGCCYLVFAAVTVRLVRSGPHARCGCFGRADSPVGLPHLVLNAGCVGIAAAAAIRPPGAFGGLFDGAVLTGAVGLGQVALLAYLGFLSVTALPSLWAARRELLEAR